MINIDICTLTQRVIIITCCTKNCSDTTMFDHVCTLLSLFYEIQFGNEALVAIVHKPAKCSQTSLYRIALVFNSYEAKTRCLPCIKKLVRNKGGCVCGIHSKLPLYFLSEVAYAIEQCNSAENEDDNA